MNAVAQANVVTVSQLAEELHVSTERVRQIIAEVATEQGEDVGLVVGRTIVLTPAEANKVRAAKNRKRKYEKSADAESAVPQPQAKSDPRRPGGRRKKSVTA